VSDAEPVYSVIGGVTSESGVMQLHENACAPNLRRGLSAVADKVFLAPRTQVLISEYCR